MIIKWNGNKSSETSTHLLVKNSLYRPICVESGYYRISVDSVNYPTLYPYYLFEMLDISAPNNWVYTINKCNDTESRWYLGPIEFNSVGYWEAFPSARRFIVIGIVSFSNI